MAKNLLHPVNRAFNTAFFVAFGHVALAVTFQAVRTNTEQRSKAEGLLTGCLALETQGACSQHPVCAWVRCPTEELEGCLPHGAPIYHGECAALTGLPANVLVALRARQLPSLSPIPTNGTANCSLRTTLTTCSHNSPNECQWISCGNESPEGCYPKETSVTAVCHASPTRTTTLTPNPTHTPTATFISVDINGDGSVDQHDLDILRHDYGKTSGFHARSDLNHDGKVDVVDYTSFMDIWNQNE